MFFKLNFIMLYFLHFTILYHVYLIIIYYFMVYYIFYIIFFYSPDSDSYRGSYFQYGARATNHFGGLDVAPGCHCRVRRTWCRCCAIVGCHCSVLL